MLCCLFSWYSHTDTLTHTSGIYILARVTLALFYKSFKLIRLSSFSKPLLLLGILLGQPAIEVGEVVAAAAREFAEQLHAIQHFVLRRDPQWRVTAVEVGDSQQRVRPM